MAANRQDAWTEDEDLMLAEVTLRHIREGSTQLAAFEEVAQKLGRTPAACGFRWNSDLRKKYKTAIQVAKAHRQKQRKLAPSPPRTHREETEHIKKQGTAAPKLLSQDRDRLNFTQVISFLEEQAAYIHALEQQIAQLKKENLKLKEKLGSVKGDYQSINEDYRTLMEILNRAKDIVTLTVGNPDQLSSHAKQAEHVENSVPAENIQYAESMRAAENMLRAEMMQAEKSTQPIDAQPNENMETVGKDVF